MGVQEIMDSLVRGDERETVCEFKAFLAEASGLADSRKTEGRFMDQLESKPWIERVWRGLCEGEKHIPGSELKVFWEKEPDTQHGT